MFSSVVAALACLCLARTSLAEPYNLRSYSQNLHNTKDISSILANIEERLRVIETVSAVQAKQSRRLDVIQDKLDHVEITLALKLDRVQLAAERLEYGLNKLQTNVQASLKESSEKIERSQTKITELAQNLTNHIKTHKTLLEKVNGAYADTWHRGLVLEALMRDGLSLVNVTRRELADGLRALARRQQRDAKLIPPDLEASFARRHFDNIYKIDQKMQDVLDAQKRFEDSCNRVQQDDPNSFTNMLDKVLNTLIDKVSLIFSELQTIQVTVRNHDTTIRSFLSTIRLTPQADASCHRLESAFRNSSHGIFKEAELKQLIEKFVALTDRADAALQRLELQISDEADEQMPESEVTLASDKLLLKLNEIKNAKDSDKVVYWEEGQNGYFEDDVGDMMDEDREILSKATDRDRSAESTTTRPHRRHLHKHPYDRGPKLKPSLP